MKRRGNHEGTIYKRADGRWETKLDLGWKDGKRDRPSIYGPTRAAVADELTRLMRKRQQGLPVRAERQTVEQYLKKWLDLILVRPRTHEKFEGVVRLHIIPDLGPYHLSKLQPTHVQAVLNRKLKSGLSLQSVKHIRTVLSIALNRAMVDHDLGRNVARLTKLPKLERKPVTPLSPDEARCFLKFASAHRLSAFYSVATAIGLRRGEGLALTWQDVDLESGIVHVNQSLQRAEGRLQLLPPKTESSRRKITLPEFAIAALRKHRALQAEERLAAGPEWKNDHNLVFTTLAGRPLEPRNVYRHFKSLLKKAGLPNIRFQDIRHTAASLLLAQGVHPRVAMEILGHSRISLTMDTYSHVMPASRNDAAAKMDAMLGGA